MRRIILFLLLATVCFGDTFTSHLKPSTDGTLDIGTPSLQWKHIYGIDGTFSGTIIGVEFDFENTDFTTSGTISASAMVAGTMTAGTLTDGTFSVAGGVITGATWNGEEIDISEYTNLIAGTNITLSDDTLNVDDAFLVNDDDDEISGVLTAAGFTTVGTVQAVTLTDGTASLNSGNLIIGNDGTIGSVSDPDALQIDSSGNIVMSQDLTVDEQVIIGIVSDFPSNRLSVEATAGSSAAATFFRPNDAIVDILMYDTDTTDGNFYPTLSKIGDNAVLQRISGAVLIGTVVTDGKLTVVGDDATIGVDAPNGLSATGGEGKDGPPNVAGAASGGIIFETLDGGDGSPIGNKDGANAGSFTIILGAGGAGGGAGADGVAGCFRVTTSGNVEFVSNSILLGTGAAADVVTQWVTDGGTGILHYDNAEQQFEFDKDVVVTGDFTVVGNNINFGNFNIVGDIVSQWISDGGTGTFHYDNALQRFEFDKDVKINGELIVSGFLETFSGFSAGADSDIGGNLDVFGNLTAEKVFAIEGNGSFAINSPSGILYGTAIDTGTITVGTDAASQGAFAGGFAEDGTIEALNDGSIALGNAGSVSTISSSGQGSFAEGFATSEGSITSTSSGSFAQGHASGGTITATGPGAFAQGQSGNSTITASGAGSFAQGSATTDDITASATNAVQFGPGTNNTADSLQVGSGVLLEAVGDITAQRNLAVTGTIKQNAITQTFSGSKTLTDGSATGFVEIAIATGEFLGGNIIYSIYVSGSGDFQSHSGEVSFAAVNKAGTVESDIEEQYLPAAEAEIRTAGGLTDDFTITDGANKITINCDAATTLGSPTLTLKYTITMHSENGITPL